MLLLGITGLCYCGKRSLYRMQKRLGVGNFHHFAHGVWCFLRVSYIIGSTAACLRMASYIMARLIGYLLPMYEFKNKLSSFELVVNIFTISKSLWFICAKLAK